MAFHDRVAARGAPVQYEGELHMRMIDRRRLLQAGGALTAAAAAGVAAPARAADTLHLLSWGWGYDKSVKDGVAARLKDTTFELQVGTNTANYAKLLAQRSNPIISGGTFNGTYSYRGHDDKLWTKIEKSDVPNAANVPDHAFLETGGVIFGVQPYAIIYNPRFVEKPKSYLDLFDPKYKGKVGLADYIFDGFAITAKAIGKSVDDVPASPNGPSTRPISVPGISRRRTPTILSKAASCGLRSASAASRRVRSPTGRRSPSRYRRKGRRKLPMWFRQSRASMTRRRR
jgi:spermidine/putrescine-binding protein